MSSLHGMNYPVVCFQDNSASISPQLWSLIINNKTKPPTRHITGEGIFPLNIGRSQARNQVNWNVREGMRYAFH
jgi:hypothetical protein